MTPDYNNLMFNISILILKINHNPTKKIDYNNIFLFYNF